MKIKDLLKFIEPFDPESNISVVTKPYYDNPAYDMLTIKIYNKTDNIDMSCIVEGFNVP